MILAAFYSALLLLAALSEYMNFKRALGRQNSLHGCDKQGQPEAKTKPFKAQFGSFYR